MAHITGIRQDGHGVSLELVYKPDAILPFVDIVLVPGLGRTSRETWTTEEPLSCFWPDWLRDSGSLRMARVWTAAVDYAAYAEMNLLERPAETIDTVVEAFRHRLAHDNASVGVQIPVVFVAHSSGGIVAKQAYLVDIANETRSTCAVLFLATPHRGVAVEAALAWGIQKGRWNMQHSLEQAACALSRINERFNLSLGDGLYVASFFERPSAGGQLIVDKKSSHLGFPREVTDFINADHENIGRYSHPGDPGYAKISRYLQLVLYWLGPFKRQVWNLDSKEKRRLLHDLLGVDGPQDDELTYLSDQHVPGTCGWIQANPQFLEWLNDRSQQPRILLLSGPPGSGKSVLASYIVRQLQGRGLPCQYFFFQHDDQSSRSVVSLIRSLACQIAGEVELFRDHLVALAAGGYRLDGDAQSLVWDKLFANELMNSISDSSVPIYWVIDGLDICDSADTFLSGLAEPSLSSIPLRILVVSRTTPSLSRACHWGGIARLDMDQRGTESQATQAVIERRLKHAPTSLVDRVGQLARGNFHEAEKIVQYVLLTGTEQSVMSDWRAESPGPKRYWRAIVSEMCMSWGADEKKLARRILTLITYASSPLTARQIHGALELDGLGMPGEDDLTRLYGPLIQVDTRSRFRMRHRTAREFLAEDKHHDLYQDPGDAHGALLAASIKAIIRMDVDSLAQVGPWAEYAISSWEYHLIRSTAWADAELLSTIEEFLNGSAVIKLIYMLANYNLLHHLDSAAAALATLHLQRRAASSKHDVDDLLPLWVTELVRIRGNFGTYLLRYPRAIYEMVPEFCPQESLVRKRLAGARTSTQLQVKGVPRRLWDDVLARITVQEPSRTACSNQHVAISFGFGKVKLVSPINPHDARTIDHAEHVSRIRFSNSGHMLAISSLERIAIWQIDIWLRRWEFAAPPAAPILDMAFDKGDRAVLACFRDGSVWRYPLDNFAGSRCIGTVFSDNSNGSRSPGCAAFNESATMLAVAYHSLPMSIWDVTADGLVGPRSEAVDSQHGARAKVQHISWTTAPCRVLAVGDGSAHMWDPDCQFERQIFHSNFTIISAHCSPNRYFVVTTSEEDMLQFWGVQDTSLLYTLECNGVVRELCSDGINVYGLRDNSCDIWRPPFPVLTGVNPSVDLISLTPQNTSMSGHDRSVETPGTVEILAVNPNTLMYCTAHSRGKVRLFDANGTPLFTHAPPYSAAITHIAWSDDGQHLAIVDTARKLSIMKHMPESPYLIAVMETKVHEAPCQILFKPSCDAILIVSTHSLAAWPFLERSDPLPKTDIDKRLWLVNHPAKPELLLGFGSHGIEVRWWANLTHFSHSTLSVLGMCSTGILDEEPPVLAARTVAIREIARVFPPWNAHEAYILVQARLDHRSTLGLFFVDVASIDAAYHNHSEVMIVHYPDKLCSVINRPLGLIASDDPGRKTVGTLLFLSKNGWLCTYGKNGVLTEHSFLPHDWLDSDGLDQMQLTKDGVLLIPRGDRVDIIVNGFKGSQLQSKAT